MSTATGTFVRTATLILGFAIIEVWPYAQWAFDSYWPEGRSTIVELDGSFRDPEYTPNHASYIALYLIAMICCFASFALFMSLTPIDFVLRVPKAANMGMRGRDIARFYGMGLPRRGKLQSVVSHPHLATGPGSSLQHGAGGLPSGPPVSHSSPPAQVSSGLLASGSSPRNRSKLSSVGSEPGDAKPTASNDPSSINEGSQGGRTDTQGTAGTSRITVPVVQFQEGGTSGSYGAGTGADASSPQPSWGVRPPGPPVAPAPVKLRVSESTMASEVRTWVREDSISQVVGRLGPVAWHLEPHLPVPGGWRGRPCGDCLTERTTRGGGAWAGDPPHRRRRRYGRPHFEDEAPGCGLCGCFFEPGRHYLTAKRHGPQLDPEPECMDACSDYQRASTWRAAVRTRRCCRRCCTVGGLTCCRRVCATACCQSCCIGCCACNAWVCDSPFCRCMRCSHCQASGDASTGGGGKGKSGGRRRSVDEGYGTHEWSPEVIASDAFCCDCATSWASMKIADMRGLVVQRLQQLRYASVVSLGSDS